MFGHFTLAGWFGIRVHVLINWTHRISAAAAATAAMI